MVDMNRNDEMDEVERRIQKEEDQMRVVYPKAGESLLIFLVHYHKKNLWLSCALDAAPSMIGWIQRTLRESNILKARETGWTQGAVLSLIREKFLEDRKALFQWKVEE